jgi:pantothenate kinase
VTPVRLSADGRELDGLLDRLLDRLPGERFLLGLAGAPGAGKSTLAAALARRLGPRAVVVPMDGFHLADAQLARSGLLDRKGAPLTFDAWGYAALLGRLRQRPDHVVYAPAFERELEQPLAGSVGVAPEADVVITEGNYLLLDAPCWRAAREQLDAVWFVHTEAGARLERLRTRHVAFGKSREEAERWVAEVDEPNAELVQGSAERADLLVDLTDWRL